MRFFHRLSEAVKKLISALRGDKGRQTGDEKGEQLRSDPWRGQNAPALDLKTIFLYLSMPYAELAVAPDATIPNPSNSGTSAKVRIRLWARA